MNTVNQNKLPGWLLILCLLLLVYQPLSLALATDLSAIRLSTSSALSSTTGSGSPTSSAPRGCATRSLTEHRVATGLEFVSRLPLRKLVSLGHTIADGEKHFEVFASAGEIPI